MQQLITFVPLILIFLVMYLLLIRPQKKREKQVNAMRSALSVGDEIVTIGGICGKIVKTKDESVIVQVGADKVKFEMMRWSISKVVSSSSKPQVTEVEVEEDAEDKPKSKPKRLKKAEPQGDVAEAAEVDEAKNTEAPEKTEE